MKTKWFIISVVLLATAAVRAQIVPLYRNAYTTNAPDNGWKAMQEYLVPGQWTVMSQNGNKWQVGSSLYDPLTNSHTANVTFKGGSNYVSGHWVVGGTLRVDGQYYGPSTIPVASLQAGGTPSSSTFLRGDGQWASLPQGGTIDYVDTGNQQYITITTNGTTYVVNLGAYAATHDKANWFLKTNFFQDEVWIGKDLYGSTNADYIHWAIKKVGNSYVFYGDGAGMTNLNASALSSGTVPTARLPSTVAYLNVAQTFSAAQTFNASVTMNGATIQGMQASTVKWKIDPDGTAVLNGASITNLNASELRSGTVPVARLPSTVARTDIANTFTANQTVNGTLTATTFVGSGSGLTGIPVTGIAATGTPSATTVLYGDGSWKAIPTVLYTGNGSPEGAVSASPPALYYSSEGGLYVKVTGTGSTGWATLIAP